MQQHIDPMIIFGQTSLDGLQPRIRMMGTPLISHAKLAAKVTKVWVWGLAGQLLDAVWGSSPSSGLSGFCIISQPDTSVLASLKFFSLSLLWLCTSVLCLFPGPAKYAVPGSSVDLAGAQDQAGMKDLPGAFIGQMEGCWVCKEKEQPAIQRCWSWATTLDPGHGPAKGNLLVIPWSRHPWEGRLWGWENDPGSPQGRCLGADWWAAVSPCHPVQISWVCRPARLH